MPTRSVRDFVVNSPMLLPSLREVMMRLSTLLTLSAWLMLGCDQTMPWMEPDSGAPRYDADDFRIDADFRFPDASGAPFGAPCTPGSGICHPTLFCLAGPTGERGFCSMTCPATSSGRCEGTPEGTIAYCVVSNVNAMGDKGCAFLCEVGDETYTCPGTQVCQTNEEPPGSGQRLCLP